MALWTQPRLRMLGIGLLAGIFVIYVWEKTSGSQTPLVDGGTGRDLFLDEKQLESLLNKIEKQERLILSYENVGQCSKNSDFYNLTSTAQSAFFRCKESQYTARRNHIHKVCQNLRDKDDLQNLKKLSTVKLNEVRYSQEFGFLLVNVCKSASSTWAKLILQLLPQDVQDTFIKKIHAEAQRLWPVPKDQALDKVAEDVTSMVVFRHPFQRVTSAYYDKVVKMKWFRKDLKELEVDLKPGPVGPDGLPEKYIPSPQAFVSLLVEGKKHTNDCHLQPQTSQMPFCEVDFGIYSRVEDTDEDKAYFLLKTNLQNKIPVPIHGNKRADGLTESSFWESVPDSLILGAYERYFWDFELLAHSPTYYLKSHGMQEKAQSLGTEFERRRRKLLGIE